MMNMVSQSALKVEATREKVEAKAEGNLVPVPAWKEHHAKSREILKQLRAQSIDNRLMQCKVDQIATHLGIVLFHLGMDRL